jgi:hypothetical protein
VTSLGEFSPNGRLLTLASCLENYGTRPHYFYGKSWTSILTKHGLGSILDDFFTNASGTDVMILKIFSLKKSAENWRFGSNYAKLCKILELFFCRKLVKIAENCDHNIDPWSHYAARGSRICYQWVLATT